MNSNNPAEHFITLFDSKFLPMGMSLHESLMIHALPFHLWILCMDELVEEQLTRISLPNVTLIPLRAIETEELLDVKLGRSRAEYCWTLTPFTFQAVFDRDNSIERVTYLDSDLFFFASPKTLLQELDASGKHVLITEHAYAPEYSHWLPLSGRFCVQFLTFRRTSDGEKVMRWWQNKCLEWCFARHENGKFGDQKYLDLWPKLFADEVHIVKQTDKTLAPWNVRYFGEKIKRRLDPVFYHFHGLKIVGPNKVLLYRDYNIGREGILFYEAYFLALCNSMKTLINFDMSIPYREEVVTLPVRVWQAITRKRRLINIA
jgi:hypothetical protein